MTEPTRDALHAETLAFLADERVRLLAGTTTRPDALTGDAKMMQDIIADAKAKRDAVLAYAAECVKRVPELEAEVERLRAQAEVQRDQLVEGLLDVWGQFSHPMGDGWAHDGGLSTLSWVAEDLVKLGAFEKHPKREWFRPTPRTDG